MPPSATKTCGRTPCNKAILNQSTLELGEYFMGTTVHHTTLAVSWIVTHKIFPLHILWLCVTDMFFF